MKTTKSIIITFTMIAMVLLMTSCKYNITIEEADEYTVDFFNAIKMENYEYATTLLHSDWSATPDELQVFFEEIEIENDVDFSNGITLKEYKHKAGALYDFAIKGAHYKLDFDLTVDDVDFYVTLEFAKNDHGFGIYNITI